MEYKEDDFLLLSGIQHFSFCRRQWGLIHIEQQWSENLRTTEGKLMHENAHNAAFTEKRGAILTIRDMRVFSRTLGISGACDVVEFIADSKGISLVGRQGTFRVRPVEYKRGEPKDGDADLLQLTAQAMCLEEMLCCRIDEGMLFYGEIRRRLPVAITGELRDKVTVSFAEMHALFDRGYTPKVRPSKSCNACSLKEICLPKLMRRTDALAYIREHTTEVL